MPDLTYFVAVPEDGSLTEQVTTLATGDDEDDIRRLAAHANTHGYIKGKMSIFKFVSRSSGDEKASDGKDIYRHHEAQYQIVESTLIPDRGVPAD